MCSAHPWESCWPLLLWLALDLWRLTVDLWQLAQHFG